MILGIGNLAAAEDGGGGMGGGRMPGSPMYNPNRSCSNKGAVIGGAGCAAAIGVLSSKHRDRAKLVGSVLGSWRQIGQ